MVAQHPAASIPTVVAAANGESAPSAEAMKGCTIQTDSTNRRTELAKGTMPASPPRSTFTPEQSGGSAR